MGWLNKQQARSCLTKYGVLYKHKVRNYCFSWLDVNPYGFSDFALCQDGVGTGSKVGVPQSGKRWAQAVKALAQHKDLVTQVTKCQHASCQMTHDQERTECGGGTECALEEMQQGGRRRQVPPSLLVLAQPLLSRPMAEAP